VKEGVRGQKTHAASIGGPSPNAAAKALMGGLKECVGMLLQDMKEDRAQWSALENRKLDLLFARLAAQKSLGGAAQNPPGGPPERGAA
jgi:CelD/BcsL family acetyltransferase involved in cellulose biosynthesis